MTPAPSTIDTTARPELRIMLRGCSDRRDAELAPESVLPCQLGDRLLGGSRLQPEKRLQLAVLEDAVLTFHRLAGVAGHRPHRLFAEVDAWFASEDADGPFTFITICDTLDLDAEYMRDGLRRWRGRIHGPAKRRPPLRRDGIGTRHRVVPKPFRKSA